MYIDVLISMWIAGFVMLLWHRILAATHFASLSWPFLPIEKIVNPGYNSNVKFSIGFIGWFFVSFFLSLDYWWLVEKGFLTYYDFGSGILYSFFAWLFTIIIIFPLLKMGFIGLKIGRWVWLESFSGWLIFGLIFGLIIS